MKRITAILLLLCILIMAGGCGSNMGKTKYQKLQLQSFSIETGGGMEGGRHTLSVRLDTEKDLVTVYKSVSTTWYLNPGAELYVVDRALLEEIKQIILEEKLYNAPNAPLSKMQVLDAATTSYHVSFSEGEYFSYSSSQALPSGVYEASNRIEALIEEYCDSAAAYPTVYAEPEGDYVFPEEQTGITLDCANEAPFRVKLKLYNGTDDTVELAGSVTLSKLDGDKVVYTDTLMENHGVELYAGDQADIILELPFDPYPEAGTYKMAYAGYEAAFEMKVYKSE